MNRRLLFYLLILATILCLSTAACLYWFAPWTGQLTFISLVNLLIGLSILAMVPIVLLTFLAPFPLTAPLGDGLDLGDHQDQLLRQGFKVLRRGDRLVVTFSTWLAVVLVEKRTASGERLIARLDANSNAGLLLMLLLLSLFLSLMALPLCIYLLLGIDHCTSGPIERALASEHKSREPVQENVGALIQRGLAQALSLADEARNAVRSAIGDLAVLTVAVAMMLGTALFLALHDSIFVGDAGLFWAAATSFAMASFGCLGIYLLLRRKPREQLRELDRWTTRLAGCLEGEATGRPCDDGQGVLELLMRAGEAMPRWMRLRRKGAYLRNPSLGLLVFLLVSMGSSMLINSWRAALSGLEGEVVLFIVGLLSVLGAVAILLFVRRWERDEEAHIASEWDERRARMQALIEGEGPMED